MDIIIQGFQPTIFPNISCQLVLIITGGLLSHDITKLYLEKICKVKFISHYKSRPYMVTMLAFTCPLEISCELKTSLVLLVEQV